MTSNSKRKQACHRAVPVKRYRHRAQDLGSLERNRAYWNFRLPFLTTSAQRETSPDTNLVNSSGVEVTITIPRSVRRLLVAGSAKPLARACCSLLMISGGVPLGADKPVQDTALKPS